MRTTLTLSLVSLFGLGVFLTGCGETRTEGTATASAATEAKVGESNNHLDGLSQSLVGLRGASAGADLKGLYKSFTTNREEVIAAIASVSSSAATVEQNGRVHLQEWNQQIATLQDPDLRVASAKRSGALRIALDELAASSAVFKGVGSDFTAQINEINRVLGLDLTVEGINHLKPSISKAVESVQVLRESFADVARKSKVITDMLAAK
jgi:hypothetical protein